MKDMNINANQEVVEIIDNALTVLQTASVGDTIDLDILKIQIPLVIYKGQKDQTSGCYIFNHDNYFSGKGTVYYSKEGNINLLCGKTIIEININELKKEIDKINSSDVNGDETGYERLNGFVLLNKTAYFLAWSLGEPNENIKNTNDSNGPFIDLAVHKGVIDCVILFELSLKLSLWDMKKYFNNYFNQILKFTKMHYLGQLEYVLTPFPVAFYRIFNQSDTDKEWGDNGCEELRDILVETQTIEIIFFIINQYSNDEDKTKKLKQEVVNSLKPGDIVVEEFFPELPILFRVTKTVKKSDYLSEFFKTEKDSFYGYATVLINDRNQFTAITDDEIIIHSNKNRAGTLLETHGYVFEEQIIS